MRNMKKLFFILFVVLYGGMLQDLSAQDSLGDDMEYILVLNSINFNEVKTRTFFENIREEFASDKLKVVSENLGLKLDVREEALAVPSLKNMEEIAAKRQYLRDKYSKLRKPRILLFIGDPGWLLCKPLFDDIWKDIPTIVSMARDVMAPDVTAMLNKSEVQLKKLLRPTEEVTRGYNVVALKQPVYIKETIHTMKQLIPDMNKIIMISDQRYISLLTRIHLEEEMTASFPDLKLQELTSPHLSTQDLLDSLTVSDKNTGVIYFSWFVPMRKSIDTYLDDNIQTIIYAFSKAPVFTLADLNPESGNFAGGHYINVAELSHSCIEVIHKILSGKQARDIPFQVGGEPQTILNYSHLFYFGISPSYYPSGAIYLQGPPSFWARYQWHIMVTLIVILFVVVVLSMRARAYAMKQQTREREVKMLEEYRELVNNMPVIYKRCKFIESPDGNGYSDFIFLDVNRSFERTFGVSYNEITGKRLSELAGQYPTLQVLLADHLTKPGTLVMEDEDGKHVYLERQLRQVHIAGMENVYDVFCLDNTPTHDAWNRTEEYRVFLEELFDNLPVAIGVRDMQDDLPFLYWNKKAEDLFGLSREEVLNDSKIVRKSSELARMMDDDDQDAIKEGGRFSGIRKYTLEDGTQLSFFINKRAIVHPNGQKWLLSTIWDMTEQQKNHEMVEELNERLQMVMKAAQLSIWTWDLKEKVIDCNNEYMMEPDCPIPTQILLPQDKFMSIVHVGDVKRIQDSFDNIIGGATDSFNEEFRVHDFMGNVKDINWIRSYATVLRRDEDGHATMLVGATLNIDAQKEMERALREAKDNAEKSNKLKSAFLANMSHEIRTPLNAIVGFSDVLAQTEDVQEKQEYVNIIESNNQLLLQLIGDILDLSKIEAGTLEFTYTDMDVNAMFTELEQSSRLRMNNPEVEITFAEHAPDLILYTDRNRLMQVMNNFMTNAMKFTRRGSIRFGYRSQPGEQLYFYLSDTGSGIPEEKQRLIFERFVKLDSFKQGTGLGLSICQSIIEKLGGEIGVTSQVGVGSTFWFRIPYLAPQAVDESAGLAAGTLHDDFPQVIRIGEEKPVILIAEDNPGNYRLFESILTKDYTLLHAWNGVEAVQLFKKHYPHLILMDIKMPLMDGYAATAEIRGLSQSVPIIAVTAYAFEEDELRILNSGFNGYLPKPIMAKSLKEKIITLLKKRLLFFM